MSRNERMIQECSVSETFLGTAIFAALILVLIAIASPAGNKPQALATSLIDAHAATPASGTRMPAPDAGATEGNVVDLTY